MLAPRPFLCTAMMLAAAVAGTGGDTEPLPEPLPATFHFDFDILPILERQGCASAYCHGSAKGRGGFKLSLFGSDPKADHRAITRDLDGRRLDLREAGNSLVLKKPSLSVKHEGGLRLPKNSQEYRTLEHWIQNGAPYSGSSSVEILGLELTREGNQLQAHATLRHGDKKTTRDVTGLTTFTCSDDRVCTVSKQGKIRMTGPGEAWVFARYAGRNARVAVLRRYGPRTKATGSEHGLDRVWLERLGELGLRPSPPAGEPQLVRRLYLDLVDRPPTPAELQRFRKLPEEQRVAKTAARLVQRREFATRWGRLLAEWMEIPDPVTDTSPRRAMHQQLRRQMVAEVAKKKSLKEIAAGFLSGQHQVVRRFADPRDRSEFVGRALLGMRIGCARCHNHPLDKWEQKDHLAFSAWFADRRPDPRGGFKEGILFHPETDEPVPPKLLPTTERAIPKNLDHAGTVRWYVLDAARDSFYRNMANRIFAALCGRGLVEPQDDHRLSNPASHESVLRLLGRELEARDLRGLVEFIVTSRLYQQGSQPGGNARTANADIRFFAVREARPLASATYKNAVRRVLGVEINEDLPASPLARQLALLNGRFLHRALEQTNSVEAILDFSTNPLQDLFELVLSRPATDQEAASFQTLLSKGDLATRKANARDLAFALLASREFGSNR